MEKGLYLLKSRSWFEGHGIVTQWIQDAVEKCKTYIENAVADDLPIPVTDHVKFSRSAFYTVGFLSQMRNFWKNLEWPEPISSSSYAIMLVNGIAECSEYYVSESAKRLDEKVNQKVAIWITTTTTPIFTLSLSLSVTHKQTMQLCIFLNNVDHIRNTLSECSKWLELDPFYDWLDEKQKIGKKCKSSVEKIIQEAHEAIHSRTSCMMLDIAKEVLYVLVLL